MWASHGTENMVTRRITPGHGGEVGRELGRGEQGEEDQGFVVGIEGAVHGARRDVGDFAGVQDAVIGPDPLLGAAGDDVDDLLPVRVPVERVTMVRRHVGAHQQQLVGGDDIGAAEPLVVCPGVGFTQGVGEQDEAAVGGVHGRGGGTGRELSAKTRRRKGRREE